MTRHDLGMTRFRQWWRRQYRSGYNGLDIASRFPGESRLFGRMLIRSWAWAVGWPLAVLLFALAGWATAGLGGSLALGGLAALVVPLQVLRMAARVRRRVDGPRTALAYGVLMMAAKWAELAGAGRLSPRPPSRPGRPLDRVQAGRRGARAAGGGPGRRPGRDRPPTGRPTWPATPAAPWLKEQSIWALAAYRFGRRVDRRRPGIVRKALERAYWLGFRVVETLTGISLPKSARVGPGLRIWHFGNVFIHPEAVLGANCTLRQGVTIGNREEGGPVPVLEDDVELGAYAQVLGGIRVGRGAKVGAMSVVLRDVPAGATAVGVPARIVERPTPPAGPQPPGSISPLPDRATTAGNPPE